MKTKTLTALCVILFSFSAGLSVEAGWWEKGTGALKALTGGSSEEPSTNEIGAAFKEALRLGSEQVTGQLGKPDGFNSDPAIHIPVPDSLKKVKTTLSKVGLSGLVDTLEMKLNRAAEAATPKAKELFSDSIKEMTFEDILAIYKGPADSATQYFKGKMSPELAKEMAPIVDTSLSQVGALQAFDNVMGKYKAIPFVPDVKTDLTDHVVQKAMDGIFYYMAQKEKAIREDPLKQTSALLKKVFGTP